jgi:hypothetical protein
MHIIVNGISVMLISIVAVITSVAAMSTVYGTSGKHIFMWGYVALTVITERLTYNTDL